MKKLLEGFGTQKSEFISVGHRPLLGRVSSLHGYAVTWRPALKRFLRSRSLESQHRRWSMPGSYRCPDRVSPSGSRRNSREYIDSRAKDFERFVNEERDDRWVENAESLILDGIAFSAFGSAYSDWAVECETAMCLTVASIDAKAYYTQQFLPQGGWMDTMLTIRNEIAPVLLFSNNGESGMHPDRETGRIWWVQEPEEAP